MPRPTTRVLAILELLQSRGRVSGTEIARHLGVDRRTVRRYISALEELGIPITTERGRDGAYLLVAGFKLPPMMFTGDEALALAVGLRAARGLGLSQTTAAVVSARAKLERVMPGGLKRHLRSIDETVMLELAAPKAANDGVALGTLSEAARAETRVNLSYRAADGSRTERGLDPYGLAYRGGRWYVVGMCHLRGGVRSFRLDRVEKVKPLATTFRRPADFNPLATLVSSIATLPRAHAIEVMLETDLASAQRALFPAAGLLEWRAGKVLFRAQADDLDWFARELARLPFAFRIASPAALRSKVIALAARLRRQARQNVKQVTE
ncbi:MAG TPA: YafY family protein [Steroidobacteraceae bacterium]|nr:YafY family protein [Steroidobacteraceae bacterium]